MIGFVDGGHFALETKVGEIDVEVLEGDQVLEERPHDFKEFYSR